MLPFRIQNHVYKHSFYAFIILKNKLHIQLFSTLQVHVQHCTILVCTRVNFLTSWSHSILTASNHMLKCISSGVMLYLINKHGQPLHTQASSGTLQNLCSWGLEKKIYEPWATSSIAYYCLAFLCNWTYECLPHEQFFQLDCSKDRLSDPLLQW